MYDSYVMRPPGPLRCCNVTVTRRHIARKVHYLSRSPTHCLGPSATNLNYCAIHATVLGFIVCSCAEYVHLFNAHRLTQHILTWPQLQRYAESGT